MKNSIKLYISLILIIISSCSSDDYLKTLDHFEGDHEEPSRIVLHFKNTDSGEIKSFVYDVPEGTKDPVIPKVILPAGIYNVTMNLFAENGEDLTKEIFEHDKEDHFIYYSKLENSNVQITYAEDDIQDSEANKIGKNTVWTITQGESMQFVYLIHQPAVKNPNAPSTEQIGGEIDLEARFYMKGE